MLYPIALRARTCIIAHRRYSVDIDRGLGMETEIKLSVASASAGREMLVRADFQIHVERSFEVNLVLDDSNGSLRNAHKLLRVREIGGKVVCTFKGPGVPGRHKQREEREFTASSSTEALALFHGLGFDPRFRYEKYRTEFARLGQAGVATLDETPIGCYLELEGDGEWIDATARELGFGDADYITASYASLYFEWCAKQGIQPGDFVFAGT